MIPSITASNDVFKVRSNKVLISKTSMSAYLKHSLTLALEYFSRTQFHFSSIPHFLLIVQKCGDISFFLKLLDLNLHCCNTPQFNIGVQCGQLLDTSQRCFQINCSLPICPNEAGLVSTQSHPRCSERGFQNFMCWVDKCLCLLCVYYENNSYDQQDLRIYQTNI